MTLCQPDEQHRSAAGWHWLMAEDCDLMPARWMRIYLAGRGRCWAWLFAGKPVAADILAARGFLYHCRAITPAEALTLKAGVCAALDTLEFDRPEPCERGRTPQQYAAHQLRLALSQGGLRT